MFPGITRSLGRRFAGAAAIAALMLSACGGSGSGGTGTLRVALTDAPACGFQAVNVTIEKVRVHQSSGAGDNDGGWSDIVLTPARRVNLLDLTNGVLQELGQTALPAGRYTQLRLVLAPNGGTNPPANSLQFVGASGEVPLTTPSGQQSGLKLNVNIDVQDGQLADVVLDFDACRSIVPRGASGQYNLKPVIAVTPRVVSVGTVTGVINPTSARGGQVSVQLAGVPVKATKADPLSGQFVLYPVRVGQYTLVVTAPDHATTVVTNVPVAQGATTAIGNLALPAAAASAVTVAGTVTTNPQTSASVRALQTITSSPTPTDVEVAWTAANDTTGAYSLSLPVVAASWAAYGTGAPFSFSASGNARAYRIEASIGSPPLSVVVPDVTTAPSPLNFPFP